MTRANTPVFMDGTDRKDIVHFKDYEANPKKVKDELKKMKRSAFPKNDPTGGVHGSTVAKKRYNKVTHKYDDNFPGEVDDTLKGVEDYEKPSEPKILKFNEEVGELGPDMQQGKMSLEELRSKVLEVCSEYDFSERVDRDTIETVVGICYEIIFPK